MSPAHLQRIYHLSCLCLDEPRLAFSPVKFSSYRTDDPLSPMFDVITPIEFFLGYVLRGLDVFTTDSSVSRCLSLAQSLGNAGLSDVYSPGDSIDHFGRGQIRETLNLSERGRQDATEASETGGSTSLKPFPLPKPNKRCSHLLFEEKFV